MVRVCSRVNLTFANFEEPGLFKTSQIRSLSVSPSIQALLLSSLSIKSFNTDMSSSCWKYCLQQHLLTFPFPISQNDSSSRSKAPHTCRGTCRFPVTSRFRITLKRSGSLSKKYSWLLPSYDSCSGVSRPSLESDTAFKVDANVSNILPLMLNLTRLALCVIFLFRKKRI